MTKILTEEEVDFIHADLDPKDFMDVHQWHMIMRLINSHKALSKALAQAKCTPVEDEETRI